MLGQKRKLKRKSMFGTSQKGGVSTPRRRIACSVQIRDKIGHRYAFKVPPSQIRAVLDGLLAMLSPEVKPSDTSSDETMVTAVAATLDPNPSRHDQPPPLGDWPWQNPSFRDEQVFQDYIAILERNRLADLVVEDDEG